MKFLTLLVLLTISTLSFAAEDITIALGSADSDNYAEFSLPTVEGVDIEGVKEATRDLAKAAPFTLVRVFTDGVETLYTLDRGITGLPGDSTDVITLTLGSEEAENLVEFTIPDVANTDFEGVKEAFRDLAKSAPFTLVRVYVGEALVLYSLER